MPAAALTVREAIALFADHNEAEGKSPKTIEWYTQVFGMKYIKPKSNTKVVLMTRGNFDLHFTPVEEMDRMAPYHFAVEVEDWHGFLAHLAVP